MLTQSVQLQDRHKGLKNSNTKIIRNMDDQRAKLFIYFIHIKALSSFA